MTNHISTSQMQDLIKKAFEARKFSYSPYSNFKVGAAILTTNNFIFTGCNVENSCFSPSICAERVALTKAVSEGSKDFLACAVVAENLDSIVYPCGVCRQVLAEFTDGSRDMEIFLAQASALEKVTTVKLSSILPFSFKLKKDIAEK